MFRILMLLVVTNFVTTLALESSDYKVELVQVLFRHGDRTPIGNSTYPLDPYNSSSYYEPYGYSQLTNNGKLREYQIGEMLRKRYGYFLGEMYKPEYVYAYSTDLDRTKMSLQLVLAGLFPPVPKLMWNKNIYWIPTAIQYNPRGFDFLSVAFECSEYEKLWNRVINSTEVKKKLGMYGDFLKYLSKSTGLPPNFGTSIKLYNVIRSQISLGLSPPYWCTKAVFKKLEQVLSLELDLIVYTNEMKKFVSGPIIKRFLKNINDSESKSNKNKIYLYSANDYTVSSLSRAHNFTVSKFDYGSTLILEKLRGGDRQIYVRFLMWFSTEKRLTVLKLNNCDEICPLSKYLKIVDPFLPIKEGTECLYENAKEKVESLIDGTNDNNEFKLEDICESQKFE